MEVSVVAMIYTLSHMRNVVFMSMKANKAETPQAVDLMEAVLVKV